MEEGVDEITMSYLVRLLEERRNKLTDMGIADLSRFADVGPGQRNVNLIRSKWFELPDCFGILDAEFGIEFQEFFERPVNIRTFGLVSSFDLRSGSRKRKN